MFLFKAKLGYFYQTLVQKFQKSANPIQSSIFTFLHYCIRRVRVLSTDNVPVTQTDSDFCCVPHCTQKCAWRWKLKGVTQHGINEDIKCHVRASKEHGHPPYVNYLKGRYTSQAVSYTHLTLPTILRV